MESPLEQVLAEQRAYYSQRAGEYEDWWYRRGRYAHGPAADGRWFAEVGRLEAALEELSPYGRVLELACGTGLWTARLAGRAEHVTALDGAPEALALARAKVPAANVEFRAVDLFAWQPAERFDLVFFSFWLSHVPAERLDRFLAKVRESLAEGGRAFLIDSARSEHASARDHDLGAPGQQLARRRLADGREYTIVKHWFEAQSLGERLRSAGWDARIESTGEFFVYGTLSPSASDSGGV